MKVINIEDKEEVCANCKHYNLHYVNMQGQFGIGFMPINYGHCVFPRVKDRKPSDTCDKFEGEK